MSIVIPFSSQIICIETIFLFVCISFCDRMLICDRKFYLQVFFSTKLQKIELEGIFIISVISK